MSGAGGRFAAAPFQPARWSEARCTLMQSHTVLRCGTGAPCARCPAPLPATPSMRGVPVRRLTGWLAPVLVPAILVAALGCREGAESPTAADSGATLDVAATAGLSFRQMSAGPAHSCGVTPDYQAYCWGSNDFGALGNGTDNPSRTPVAVVGGLPFRQVS